MDSAVVAAIVGQGIVLGGLLLGDLLTRRREVELRLANRKQKLYADFMDAQHAMMWS